MKFVMKLSSVTALLLALISGGALFWVSQQVQQTEREQRKLQLIITQEKEAIRVLDAEWDYLNRPDRLEVLANEYLKMEPAQADDLLQSVNAIPEPMPEAEKEKAVFASTKSPAKKPAAKPVRLKPDVPPSAISKSDEDSFKQLLNTLEQQQ